MVRYGRHVGEVTAPQCGHLGKLAFRCCVTRDVTASDVTSHARTITSPRAPATCSALLFFLFFFLILFSSFFLKNKFTIKEAFGTKYTHSGAQAGARRGGWGHIQK